jgi:hypothetical protein
MAAATLFNAIMTLSFKPHAPAQAPISVSRPALDRWPRRP